MALKISESLEVLCYWHHDHWHHDQMQKLYLGVHRNFIFYFLVVSEIRICVAGNRVIKINGGLGKK